ncbi:hypothetical protein [Spiroplasma platyhelix]|nr:hypothetical protein [Spiroplasma platyhelix]UJB28937.1 hypothetical protein SPLAT_v1c01720 [Spiroplasma platyhelix PALS-1]
MKKVFLVIAGLGLTSSAILTNVKLGDEKTVHSALSYNELYILGDSLSDTGSLVGAASEILKEFQIQD